MARMVKQFSIDIEMDVEDELSEEDIERALFSYWYAEKAANREVLGIMWKATWNKAESYHKADYPDSWD